MSLPADLLLRAPEEAVRLLALERVDEVEREVGRLADADDEDAVHDVRVALRRLRSTLRSWKRLLEGSVRTKDREALAELQRSTGRARDAEVGERRTAQIAAALSAHERRGAAWLAQRLGDVARGERRTLAKSLEKPLRRRLAKLRERLATWPARVVVEAGLPAPRFAAPLAHALERHAEALIDGLAGLGPEANEAAHETRIRGKRLRYLVEPFVGMLPGCEEALARLKAVQDDLGALQDSVVLADTVAQGLEDAAVEQARALAEAARDGRALPAARNDLRAGLVALAQRVEGERRERGLRLAHAWREGEERRALADALERVVEEARAHAHAGIEIERKYVLRGLPPLPPGTESVEVEQGWLPGERLQERLRRVRKGGHTEHWRTVKLGRGLTRVEIEEPCDAGLFERLWPLTEGLRVTKRRHVVREGAHAFEIDEFLDREMVLLEVELSSAEEEVVLPGWLAPFVVRDVTGEDAYVNRRLAR